MKKECDDHLTCSCGLSYVERFAKDEEVSFDKVKLNQVKGSCTFAKTMDRYVEFNIEVVNQANVATIVDQEEYAFDY